MKFIYFRSTTWLCWALQLRWTFRRRLHCVHRLRPTSCRSLLWHDHWWRRMDGWYHKKLSCRREAARCFVSLNVWLSHWRSLKVIRN